MDGVVGNKLKEKMMELNMVYFFLAGLMLMLGNILLLRFNTSGGVGITTYNHYPFMYIVAIAGTILVLEVSHIICRMCPIIFRICIYIGKHSMTLLIVHSFDFLWMRLIPSSIDFPITIIKIVTDLIILVVTERSINRVKRIKYAKLNDIGSKPL